METEVNLNNTVTVNLSEGGAKILKKCALPLTAVGVASMVITEFAVFSITDGKMTLIEKAPEVTLEQIRDHTEADFDVADPLPAIKGMEVG